MIYMLSNILGIRLANSLNVLMSRLTPGPLSHTEGTTSIQQGTLSKQQTREDRGTSNNHAPPRYIKRDFPRYSGTEPTEWLHRITHFFEYQGIPEDQKVPLASFHLEGEANIWL